MITDPTSAAFIREVARRVRLHRLVQRLTQQDVADRAGLSRSFISLFEKGEHGIDIVALVRIAGALGVPLSELVTDPAVGDG
jgi:transcriptional regulator with XRE-family HTH domain